MTTTVPFGKLVAADEINARGATKDGLDELAASIASKGLIQPLAVRPAGTGDKWEIIDGRRRFQAMQRLVKARTSGWSKTTAVPVLVRNEDDAEALETSLMANTVRLPMHPVDQHAVFARLAEQGKSEADIASRFGLAERAVRQQLALGRLAPEIRKAYRDGKIDDKVARLFTIEPRPELQVAAYERIRKAEGRLSEWSVRREMTGARLPKSDVPPDLLALYLKAGGTLVEDLFEDASYVADGALLREVRAAWSAEVCAGKMAELLAQGWSWVAAADELPRHWRWGWHRLKADYDLTDEQESRQEELRTQAFKPGTSAAEMKRLEREAEAIEEAVMLAAYTPEQRARAGVVIEIEDDGRLELACGVIKPAEDGQADIEDALDDEDDDTGDDSGDVPNLPSVSAVVGGTEDDDAAPSISGALLETITSAQTKAMAVVVAQDTELAMRLAVAALRTHTYESPAKLSIEQTALDRPVTGGGFAGHLAAVRRLSYGEVMQQFSQLVAASLSVVSNHNDATRTHCDALVAALDGGKYLIWMRETFTPLDYFTRAGKAVALAAIEEMREAGVTVGLAPEDELAGMKKTSLANIAAAQATICGWLPEQVRHPAYRLEASAGAARLTGKMAAAEQTGEPAKREAA